MKFLNHSFRVLVTLIGTCVFLYSCTETVELGTADGQLNKGESIIPGEYIVTLKEEGTTSASRTSEPNFGTDRNAKSRYSSQKRGILQRHVTSVARIAGVSEKNISQVYTSVIVGFAAKMSDKEVKALRANPSVLSIEPNTTLSISQLEVTKGTNVNAAQSSTCAISNAGGSVSGAGKSAWIWIADTGIDLDHPDLNVVTNTRYAKSFVGGSPDDCDGHGTHVAGIAAAINNSIGVVGVSAGAPVVPIRVLGCKGTGSTAGIIAGMDHIAANDLAGDVVNMSLGSRFRTGCPSNGAYRRALERLNDQSWVALAAGNSSDDTAFYDPGCQNLSRVFTVASMTCGKGFSSFSNFGSPVDYIATGSSVRSTYKNGGYATLSGTSMASPVIAGILHQRNAAPRACGTVTSRGRVYTVGCR